MSKFISINARNKEIEYTSTESWFVFCRWLKIFDVVVF